MEVVGGNHGAIYNLFERWPPMRPSLAKFLGGKRVAFPSVVVDSREVTYSAPATSKQ